MELSGAPTQLVTPWGNGDATKTNPVPVASQQGVKPGAASWTDGFPPLCAEPATSGGIPPAKSDMNGGLYQMSAVDVWMCAGGSFPYSSSFSTAIGGYPKGARVFMASGLGYWISTADSNATDPDTGGAGWIAEIFPRNRVSSVYASGQNTITNGSAEQIVFDTVEFDPASMWNATGKYFVAPWTGNYRLSGSVLLQAPPGQLYTTSVFHNGEQAKTCMAVPQVSDQDLNLTFDAIIACVVGDYLAAYLTAPNVSVTVGGSTGNEIYVYEQVEFLG